MDDDTPADDRLIHAVVIDYGFSITVVPPCHDAKGIRFIVSNPQQKLVRLTVWSQLAVDDAKALVPGIVATGDKGPVRVVDDDELVQLGRRTAIIIGYCNRCGIDAGFSIAMFVRCWAGNVAPGVTDPVPPVPGDAMGVACARVAEKELNYGAGPRRCLALIAGNLRTKVSNPPLWVTSKANT